MKYLALICVFLGPFSISAANDISFTPFVKTEFSPAQGDSFTIPFNLKQKAKVHLKITSPDGDLVRVLISKEFLGAGTNALTWDGKDLHGNIVADEAYLPIISATNENGNKLKNKPAITGGVVLKSIDAKISPKKNISFKLPVPARVLSRVGIKGGAMLKTLSNWEPKNKGKNIIRWDGFDQDNLRDIRNNSQLSILVRAYSLPDNSIITHGNKTTSYSEYRKKIKSPDWKPINKNNYLLERNNQRIDRHHYMPKSMTLSPTVLVEFIEKFSKDNQGRLLVKCPCPIKVNLVDKEKPQLQKSLYEIAFFIDDQFVSEQEQGYVPFTWNWNPSNLKEGEHMLTVNVSGLRGEVGVKSILFFIGNSTTMD